MSKNGQKTRQKPQKYITERIKIEKLIPGGQGLATLENGKKIFLWNALPGEIIAKVRVTKEKASYVEGVAEEIAKKSALRVEPKDECYLATSPWQILSEQYEADQKDELLREIFRQHDIEIPQKLQDFQIEGDGKYYYYRNKMEYALYYSHEDEKIHLAFHERGSHRKIPIAQSSLEMPEIWQCATEIVDELNRKGEDARKYQSLLLRCNEQGEVSGGLLENGKPHPRFQALTYTIKRTTYSFSPDGFFQINFPVYNELVLTVIDAWCHNGAEKVLDLYSGVGTIGLSTAWRKDLTLVECNKNAYAEMVNNVENIKREMVENYFQPRINPVLAKSEEALDYIEHDQIVIVDPPRAGCMPEVIERFLEVEPERIIYLSCNPATQARDVKKLLEKYEIAVFQPFNFFPRTPHIENLIALERKN